MLVHSRRCEQARDGPRREAGTLARSPASAASWGRAVRVQVSASGFRFRKRPKAESWRWRC